MLWETIAAPPGLAPPRPMTMRAQSIPARHYFPEHAHRWNQVVYAISGVLTVAVEGRSWVTRRSRWGGRPPPASVCHDAGRESRKQGSHSR
jgi:hypothetical protein